ncbi:unnamed protein product [Ectocarpus sp. 8 AP-2014]
MEELFEQLQDDTRSFWQHPSSGVRRLDTMPQPAEFFRDYVATSTPVILSGGGCFKGGGRRSCWDDLASLAGRDSEGLEVTVDFTPDGRGDCVVDVADGMLSEPARTTAVFVKPEERRMKFEAFVSTLLTGAAARAGDESSSTRGACRQSQLENSAEQPVHSCHPSLMILSTTSPTEQNDSLRQEFPGLMEDVEPFLALAREAFGNEPDAVNLWIGDDRSLSAVHKDHYEVRLGLSLRGSSGNGR